MLQALALALTLTPDASAQDMVDIGVLRNEDIAVVQNLLYPKQERTEVGVHLGLMPFDAYLWTPNAQLSFNKHMQENLSFSLVAGGGYGLKTAAYQEMESPSFGAAPYAYRYLASLLAGMEWNPIYAKLNLDGAHVVHFDVYLAGRAGVTLSESVIPLKQGGMSASPTLSPALGARLWLNEDATLRVELRDDVLLQNRSVTDTWHVQQNMNVTAGMTFFSARGSR